MKKKKEEKLRSILINCVKLGETPQEWNVLVSILAHSIRELLDCTSRFNEILEGTSQYDDFMTFFQDLNFSASGIYYYFRKTANAYDLSFGNIVPDSKVPQIEEFQLPVLFKKSDWNDFYQRMIKQLEIFFNDVNFNNEYFYVSHPVVDSKILKSCMNINLAELYADLYNVINAVKLLSISENKPFEWVDQILHIYLISDQRRILTKLSDILNSSAFLAGIV